MEYALLAIALPLAVLGGYALGRSVGCQIGRQKLWSEIYESGVYHPDSKNKLIK